VDVVAARRCPWPRYRGPSHGRRPTPTPERARRGLPIFTRRTGMKPIFVLGVAGRDTAPFSGAMATATSISRCAFSRRAELPFCASFLA